jgi:hypothetical protein
VFHACCHVEGFPETVEKHKFPDAVFDSYVKKINEQF